MSMKSGASEDPFEEEEAETDETNGEQQDDEETVIDNQSGPAKKESTRDATTTGRQAQQTGQQDLPYLVRRKLQNKSIQHERDRVPFFLREPILEGEKDFRRAVENAIEDDVPKADLREAAYIVAQRHVDEVVAELREMGYDWER